MKINRVSVLIDNVHHIDRHHNRNTKLGELGGEVQVAFQVGAVNVIRDSELAFCPIVNIGFDIFPNY